MIKMSYEEIKRIYERLPEAEKKMAVISVKDKVYTWEEVLAEVEKGGELADQMQKKIEELGEE